MFDIKINDEVVVSARGIVEAIEKRYDGKILYRVKGGNGNLLFCLATEVIPVDKQFEKALKEIL